MVVILEPSAIDISRTHAAGSLVSHTRVMQLSHQQVVWVVNRKCALSGIVDRSYRLFGYTIYDEIGKRYNIIRRLVSYVRRYYLKRTTYKAVAGLFDDLSLTSADHVLIPTTDWILFQVIMQWIAHHQHQDLPNFHFLVMYELADWMIGGYPYELVTNSLVQSGLLGKRIHVYTETTRHAHSLGHVLGIDVDACPYPILSDSIARERAHSRETLRICLLGGGRRDKGFASLEEIIHSFLCLYDGKKRVEFIVQKPRDMDKLTTERDRLLKIKEVIMLDNQIGVEQYRNNIDTCDIMIFPYSHRTYYSRGSGIVCEAVAAGLPIVVTRDTALEERITHNNGLSADVGREFAEALLKVSSNLQEYSENAVAAAEHYHEMVLNSAIVRNITATTAD